MTTATPRSAMPASRAELRQERRRSSRSGARRRGRANRWLVVLAVGFVIVAVGLGVFAVLAWQDANDVRDATKPLEARAAQLHADLTTADSAIDRLTALFGAVRAQSDATTAAVDLANQAAQQFNNAQSGIAAALGGNVASVGATLAQSTTEVQTAVDGALAVVADLERMTERAANG